MAEDKDWIADVQRWCRTREPASQRSHGGRGPCADEDDASASLGYEAAHPALQARHWPDAAAAASDGSH